VIARHDCWLSDPLTQACRDIRGSKYGRRNISVQLLHVDRLEITGNPLSFTDTALAVKHLHIACIKLFISIVTIT
jgi:hypothetical protein